MGFRGYWDAHEEEMLRRGVQKHGIGSWERIRHDPEFRVLRRVAQRLTVPAACLWWRAGALVCGWGGVVLRAHALPMQGQQCRLSHALHALTTALHFCLAIGAARASS